MKTNFTEHGATTMNPPKGRSSISKSVEVPNRSKEERKLTRMRETKSRVLMQRELMVCRDEFDWLKICFYCVINSCPEENCPPVLLPVPPDYGKINVKRAEMVEKEIIPPTLKIILKTHHPLPVKQQPPIPPPSDIPPFPSPLPSA